MSNFHTTLFQNSFVLVFRVLGKKKNRNKPLWVNFIKVFIIPCSLLSFSLQNFIDIFSYFEQYSAY